MHLILTFACVSIGIFVNAKDEKYTQYELNAINEFREIVKDVIAQEYEEEKSFLIRWLQAKNMNIRDAADMFRENQRWRKENSIDTIVNETILEFNPVPYTIDGFDKEGYPILIFTPAHIDLRRLLIQGLRDKVMRYWFQMMERAASKTREVTRLSGKEITKSTQVLDMHGYNLRQHACISCVFVFRDFFITLEKYYPEMVRHFVVINIPRIAIPVVDIIRPLLSPSTDKVLKLFPPDREQWSKFLLQIADSDQLPYRFGGTKNT